MPPNSEPLPWAAWRDAARTDAIDRALRELYDRLAAEIEQRTTPPAG